MAKGFVVPTTLPLTAEQRDLATANEALALFVLSKHFRGACAGPLHDDVYSAAFWGLSKAAQAYDPAQGPFAPFAYRTILGFILRALNQARAFGFTGLNLAKPCTIPRPASLYARLGRAESTIHLYQSLPDRRSPDPAAEVTDVPRPSQKLPALFRRRLEPDPTAPRGCRRVKGHAWQCRPWVAALKRNVNLGLFTVTACGSEYAAMVHAGRCVHEFYQWFDPDRPGHDLEGTKSHLADLGLLPTKVRPRSFAA